MNMILVIFVHIVDEHLFVVTCVCLTVCLSSLFLCGEIMDRSDHGSFESLSTLVGPNRRWSRYDQQFHHSNR